MTIRAIKRRSTPTPVAALPAQIRKHCPSVELSSVARTVLSVLPPTRAVGYGLFPTRVTDQASTTSVAAFTPCNGIPVGSQSFSSLVDQYQQISQLRLLSHPLGVLLWLDGPRSLVIRSSSSTTTSLSSIPPSAAIGLLVYGHQRGYPARNRAALLELATPHVKTLFVTADRLSTKLIRKLYHTNDTRITRHDIHACFTSCSLPFPLLPFRRMLVPYHIALAQVNDATKFKPLYSLVHNPSEFVSL